MIRKIHSKKINFSLPSSIGEVSINHEIELKKVESYLIEFSKMIEISTINKSIYGTVDLESSKSISNRLLFIKELCKTKIEIQNLSNAKDTKILNEILNDFKTKKEINCEDAGTALRFAIAFLATKKGNWKISGSKRMHERPIKPLIDCLLKLEPIFII